MSVLSLALPSTGCLFNGFGSGSPPDDDGGDVMEVEGRDELRACAGELPAAQVDINVQITADYAQSLHEMVACGGLAVALCVGVTQGIVEALINNSSDATPKGWTYDGEGVYRTSNPGVEMTTRFYAAEDFSFAAKGEPIHEDIFLIHNYLDNPRINIDYTTGRTELRFDGVGPLVELLGLGDEPESPIALTLDDLDTLNEKLAVLEFDSTVVVDDPQGASTINYLTESPRLPAQALLAGTAMEFELVEASGMRDDTEQDLQVEAWTIEFVGGNRLEGSSSYHVVGGDFDFYGEAFFDNSSYAETTVSCTQL